jgi:hypothetical protein
VLLPQVTAQEIFGRLLRREGLAAAVLDVDDLDPPTLAAALARAAEPAFAERARHWQAVVASEGGVEEAVDLIEAHWRSVTGAGGASPHHD